MKQLSTYLLSILLLSGWTLQAQTFKVAIELIDQNPGIHLQTRELKQVPGTNQYLIVGDVKGNAPAYENQAFLIRTDQQGDPVIAKGIGNNIATAVNGVRGAAITIDSEGNYYFGGASVQSFQGVGRGSEKTIVSLDGTGNLRWTTMANNWSYEALDFHHDQQQLYAFSGPDNGFYPADLLVSRFAKDGRFIDGTGISNGLENEAVALISDQEDTYFLVATTAADISPAIYIASVDTAMGLNWGAIYEETQHTYEVKDAAWQADGYLLITGQATHKVSGRKAGFILSVNPDGSERYLRHYFSGDYESLDLSGIAGTKSFRDPSLNGAIVVGTVSDSGSLATRTIAIAVDTAGAIRWVQGYSDFGPGDVVYTCSFSDVIASDNSDDFIAIGQYEVRNYGSTLVERRATMVKAPLSNGHLDDNGNCLQTLSASSQVLVSTATASGTSAPAGSSNGFVYNISDLNTNRNWCTLEYTGGGITPPGSGGFGDRRIHPFADEFERFELRAISRDHNSINIGISNPGRLQNLRYEVMDLNGRTIAGADMLPDQQLITVNSARWAQSLYLLRVIHGGETIATQTLVPGPIAQ